jgi:hypothetical protein
LAEICGHAVQIDKAYHENELLPAIARIVRTTRLGLGHLEDAERPDLMLETLVLDQSKPYHRLFSAKTLRHAGRGWRNTKSATREIRGYDVTVGDALRKSRAPTTGQSGSSAAAT